MCASLYLKVAVLSILVPFLVAHIRALLKKQNTKIEQPSRALKMDIAHVLAMEQATCGCVRQSKKERKYLKSGVYFYIAITITTLTLVGYSASAVSYNRGKIASQEETLKMLSNLAPLEIEPSADITEDYHEALSHVYEQLSEYYALHKTVYELKTENEMLESEIKALQSTIDLLQKTTEE